jgi:hypothetical protein
MIMAAQAMVGKFLETFKDVPPRQKAASHPLTKPLEKMAFAATGGNAPKERSLILASRTDERNFADSLLSGNYFG